MSVIRFTIYYPIVVILVTILAATIALPTLAGQLKPFTSDGCSVFPDGTFTEKNRWLRCCVRHDYDYWQGGSYQQRIIADKALKSCVTKIGEPKIATIMLAGVRVGGTPYLPTQFRWGYGWPYPKFYGRLTAEELTQVHTLSLLIKPEWKAILKDKIANLASLVKDTKPN
jgi:hypothetical protein